MPLHVALLGAESTGKSQLGEALRDHLNSQTRLRTALIPEVLRDWCDREGRTPRADEQLAIAREQARRGEAAGVDHDLVLHDTTPLMTAVYSELLFDDLSVFPFALQIQARMDATLLMALDLPWVADGLQRDGPQVRVPVDQAIRRALLGADLRYSLVTGQGPDRLHQALNALAPLLRPHLTREDGLFGRLASRDARLGGSWRCDDCDDPACEHATRLQRR